MTAGIGARAWSLTAAALLLGIAGGCTKQETGISQATYHKVKHGMTYDQVKALIGEGTPIEMDAIKKLSGMERFAPAPAEFDVAPPGAVRGGDGGGVAVKKDAPKKEFKWYKFGTDDKYMVVGFMDGVMYDKDQSGIFPPPK
jgi:hypothetical protein